MHGGDCHDIGALRGPKSQIEGWKPKTKDANLRLIALICRENCSFTRIRLPGMWITSKCGTDGLDSETMPESYGFSSAYFIGNVGGILPAKDSPDLLPASKS
jgi:hypothetical protein